MKEEDLTEHSVEDWCKEQIGWLKHSVEAVEGDQDWEDQMNRTIRLIVDGTEDGKDYKSAAANLLCNVLSHTPLAVELDAIAMCTVHVDRPAIAVMIVCILWYEAKQRGSYDVFTEDVKPLLYGKTSPDEWRVPWESQKYVTKDKRLKNLLDKDACFKSLRFKEDTRRKYDKVRMVYYGREYPI